MALGSTVGIFRRQHKLFGNVIHSFKIEDVVKAGINQNLVEFAILLVALLLASRVAKQKGKGGVGYKRLHYDCGCGRDDQEKIAV